MLQARRRFTSQSCVFHLTFGANWAASRYLLRLDEGSIKALLRLDESSIKALLRLY